MAMPKAHVSKLRVRKSPANTQAAKATERNNHNDKGVWGRKQNKDTEAQGGHHATIAKAANAHTALREILGEDNAIVKALAAEEAVARAQAEAAKPQQSVKNAEANAARKRTQVELAQKAIDERRARLEKAAASLAEANVAAGKAQGELELALAREANPSTERTTSQRRSRRPS